MSTVPDLTLDAGLPANIDAEKTILGAILLDNEAHVKAAEILKPDDFSLDSHRRIFLRMSELADAYRAIDIITLKDHLQMHKEVEAVGGVAYLASLTEGLPRRPVIEDYIRIVKDKSLARRLMGICSATIARLADQAEPAMNHAISLGIEVETALSSTIESDFQSPEQFFAAEYPTAESMIEKRSRSHGIDTGYRAFDEMTSGLQRGELMIIAARPSMGKTALAMNIAEHVSVNCEGRVIVNSMEMSRESLLGRAICSRARVPFKKYKNGTLSEDAKQMQEFTGAYQDFRRSQLLIDDQCRTAIKMSAHWRALKQRFDFDLGIVDYLTLFQHEENSRRYRDTRQLVATDCLTLKLLAKELNIPVIALCQLGREVTKRTDKRPNLADLRESGNIEEIADVISFVHREAYYNNDADMSAAERTRTEWIIGKQRNGPVGTVDLNWLAYCLRFEEPFDAADLQRQEYINW
jgi:replicative DNA helicase